MSRTCGLKEIYIQFLLLSVPRKGERKRKDGMKEGGKKREREI